MPEKESPTGGSRIEEEAGMKTQDFTFVASAVLRGFTWTNIHDDGGGRPVVEFLDSKALDELWSQYHADLLLLSPRKVGAVVRRVRAHCVAVLATRAAVDQEATSQLAPVPTE